MNILLLQRVLPSYRHYFFESLIKSKKNLFLVYGNQRRMEFLNETTLSQGRAFKVRNYYLFNKRIYLTNYIKFLFKIKPKIIIIEDDLQNLNLYYLLILRVIFKFEIIIWSLGYSLMRGFDPKIRYNDRLRLYIYNKSVRMILYTKTGYDLLSKYINPKKLTVAPNTLDTQSLGRILEKLERKGKSLIKNELGIKSKYHLMYVGRFLKDKDIHLLVKAFNILQKKEIDVSLTLIGDGPYKSLIEKEIDLNSIQEVCIRGELYNDYELGKFFYVSDLCVIPGRLGNTVVHAFAFKVPVISQKKLIFHDGEGIEYLIDGYNGLLFEKGNYSELADKIEYLLNNLNELEALKENALKTVREKCSIEIMLVAFKAALEKTTN